MSSEWVSLKQLNTLGADVRARALRYPSTPGELRHVLEEAHSRSLPVLALGEGSNVVLAGDLQAMVVCYRGQDREITGDHAGRVGLRIAGGVNWHALTVWTLEQGFFGLENLALIPGTVGAAPIQNIGAYGVELATFVDSVEVMEISSGKARELSAADCHFGYRDSVFKGRLRDRCVITAVNMTLRRDDQAETGYAALRDYLVAQGSEASARNVHAAVVALRRARLPDPRQEPNVGSFFKNPVVTAETARTLLTRYPEMPAFDLGGGLVKLSAGWLIEACGWKGFAEAGVGVHAGHALVLVNRGSDSGAAVLALAARIQDSVHARFACRLEIEPRVYGVAA